MADQVAENPMADSERKGSIQFPNESILTTKSGKENWKLYFDRAANVYGCGIRVVLVSPEGNQFPASARLTFPCTNTIIEYEACIMGLRMVIDMEIQVLEVFGDSSLIIF